MPSMADAIGIGFAAISEEHLYTFLLSSPFTSRNIVRDMGDIEEVKKDLKISLWLSIATGLLFAIMLDSKITALFGTAFGILLYEIYRKRGKL